MKTKSVVRTRVRTITCPECKEEFYSRARHDFRYCSCQSTMVDGGFDYLRMGGKDLSKIKTRLRYVKFTRQELYTDWNCGFDKLGVITRGVTNAKA